MRKIFILLLIPLLLSSCIEDSLFTDSHNGSIIFKIDWGNRRENSELYKKIVIENDTLELLDTNIIISDIKLIGENNTYNLSDYLMLKDVKSVSFRSVKFDSYKISFTIGLDTTIHNNLNSFENLYINDNYYILKSIISDRYNEKTYFYNLTDISKEISYFDASLDGFKPGAGIFVNQAEIYINLENILLTPNIINKDELTESVIDNEKLQIKMFENLKNSSIKANFIYD
ncbi:hypothetical protein [uncultured Polaribacter sp.]|uniref:hypothetical protein n=1 Tax=uncultured Polaribacter sp. TaxID=174711 RepID=UPI00262CFB87|nr:hypothetical protein [uncultured Polaribacter sp.]